MPDDSKELIFRVSFKNCLDWTVMDIKSIVDEAIHAWCKASSNLEDENQPNCELINRIKEILKEIQKERYSYLFQLLNYQIDSKDNHIHFIFNFNNIIQSENSLLLKNDNIYYSDTNSSSQLVNDFVHDFPKKLKDIYFQKILLEKNNKSILLFEINRH